MNIKKIFVAATSMAICATMCAGCSKKVSDDISVVSREEGSGTRGAFVELLGIEEKDASGNKIDNTIKSALVANGTDVVMTQVKGNKNAIGYISLGSLNDTVKALKVDGVEATAENIKSGKYKVARPFNIATKGKVSEVAKDFIDFIMSKEGQAIVADKYISVDDKAPAYAGKKPTGKIVITGSTSVAPVMEKLAEAYQKINPNAKIELSQSDSSSGMKDAMNGNCDIGMASRALKDSEKATLTEKSIALDGIAVIVNKENKLSEISAENVKKIYIGELKKWAEIK